MRGFVIEILNRLQPLPPMPGLRFEAAYLEAQELLGRTTVGRPDRSGWAGSGQADLRVYKADRVIAAAGVAIMESGGTGHLACYGSTTDVFRQHAFTSLDPSAEVIALPRRGTVSTARYYILAFHELAHWTGARERLGRESLREYSKMRDEEEFVAEFTSLILSRFFELGDAFSEHQVAQAAQNYMGGALAKAALLGTLATTRETLLQASIRAARALLLQANIL